ncbi:MAG: alkaline phosphatase PhoX [Longimicrobiaceae bacterium]
MRRGLVAAAVIFCAACRGDGTGSGERGFRTAQPALAVGMGGAAVTPILSVGDTLPDGFVWAPLPDGLGGYPDGGRLVLFANHELGVAGVAGTDGVARFRYARVSRLVLDPGSATVLAGSYAVDSTAQYRNLCAATFAGEREGLPSGWFLTGEEQADGRQLAVSGAGQVVEMPWMGRFAHENTVAIPGFTGRVVLAGLDDRRGQSELYLYVAASEADVLAGRGTLYVFTTAEAANVGELGEMQGVDGRFVEIPNAASLTAAQLQAAADARGAFRFVRLEDGDYDRAPGTNGLPALYFVDTGAADVPAGAPPWDPFGSIYRMEFSRTDPTQVRMTLMARSAGPASGWASPDNVATSARSLMVQEDPAHPAWARAPRIWRFALGSDRRPTDPRAVAELLNPECAFGASTCWESSGIVDASAWMGEGTWLFDVQAHSRPEPRLGIAREAGQLLRLRVPGS